MSIPLIQKPEKDDINTSIIAIKRNIERINMLLGLSNSEEIDTSEFVKKSDIVDVVEAGNMNPVTSNAVVPVDEVAIGNMQSVSSNSVAEAFNNISFKKDGWYLIRITDTEYIGFKQVGGVSRDSSGGYLFSNPTGFKAVASISTNAFQSGNINWVTMASHLSSDRVFVYLSSSGNTYQVRAVAIFERT